MKVKKASSKLVAIAVAFALIAGSGTGSVAALEKGPRASPEQVQAIETWTYMLAVQAATYGAPLVAMYNLRSSVAFGAKQYTLTLKPPMAYAQPVPPGPFYLIFRNYAPNPSVSEGLKNRATFEGPPGVMPVGGK